MKKRVLLALTMAMATAAMFISPALAETVGLPALVVSATSNNTQTSTQTPAAQAPAASATSVASVATASGEKVTSTVAVSNANALPTAVTTPSSTLAAAAGLQKGETLIPTITTDVGEQAQQVITNAAISTGAQVAYTFDIRMVVDGRKTADNTVTEMGAPVSFVMTAPAGYDGNVYDFAVVRIHDGVVTILPDLDNDPTTITFASNQFSAYGIIYAEKGKLNLANDNSSAAKDSVPKTGDELPAAIPVTATVCLMAMAATAVVLNRKKRA